MPAAGYELDRANLRGLERTLSIRFFLFLWSLLKGSSDCLRILRRRDPDAVVGGGGYVSAVPVFWAAVARRPTLIMEMDSHMGLANRTLAPLVSRVALSFPVPGREGKKYLLSGRPMGPELLSATAVDGRSRYNLTEELPVVLVTGGSQGARSINLACVDAFGHGELAFQLVHVSGRRDYAMVNERLKETGADPANYHLLDYTIDLPLAVAAADLVVGRSGASVQELAALGKPALLVPYPHATADHQRRNAEWMAAAGAARIIDDGQLSGNILRERVMALLADREQLDSMAAASAALGDTGGAGRIAAEIYTMTGRA